MVVQRHEPPRPLGEVFNTFRDKVGSLDADISFKKLKDKTGSISLISDSPTLSASLSLKSRGSCEDVNL